MSLVNHQVTPRTMFKAQIDPDGSTLEPAASGADIVWL